MSVPPGYTTPPGASRGRRRGVAKRSGGTKGRKVILADMASAQIVDTVTYTRKRFGRDKGLEYAGLIRAALRLLKVSPYAGTKRPEIHPEAYTLHIAKPGMNARHMFLYRVRKNVEVARLLYDAMNLQAQLPDEWK